MNPRGHALALFLASTLTWPLHVRAAADVLHASIGKGRIYAQTNAGAPELKYRPYIFEVSVQASGANVLNDAWYSLPAFPVPPGAWVPVPPPTPSIGGYHWYFRDTSLSQSALDASHANGNHYLRFTTVHDGSRTNTLPLNGSVYPNPPHVANYTAAQTVDPAADFTLNWDPFTGGTINDLVTLVIFQATNPPGIVFRTIAIPGDVLAINGTQTTLTIPAGTLSPGRVYLGRLRFDNTITVDRTSYPGEVGYSTYFAATDFFIATLGADSETAPRVISVFPTNGATNVPRDSPVIFTFNKEMRRASSYSYGGWTTNPISFWTTDRRSFVLMPALPNGPATNITWNLQFWHQYVLMGDPAGNVLFTDFAGSFTTSADTAPPPAPPRLEATQVSANVIELRLHGETNGLYIFQSTTNAIRPPPATLSWTAFATNVAQDGTVRILTTNPPAAPRQRLFRALRIW